jgi:catechol 2,3-dioxygenase
VDGTKLPADITLGPVHLTIANLDRSITFYTESIGLRLIGREGKTATLGAGQSELAHLVEEPGAMRVPWRTGLYHFALLVPSREALGHALRNLIATRTKLTGGADHLVSEALYLDDPDGNGIEIYRDRPREDWPRRDGLVQMDTLPLDYDGILAAAGGPAPDRFYLHPDTVMGHVHLHVARIDETIAFYRDVIGLDLQLRFGPSAAFLSAGGYHHHLGANTWAGVGAPPPPDGATGLRYFVIALPDKDAANELISRLQEAGVSYRTDAAGLFVRDPSQNTMLFAMR